MQLSFINMWRTVKNVFGSICFLGIVVQAAKNEDLNSLLGKDKFVAGCTLENINPAGFQMCRKLCKKRTNCCLINFNVDKLTCSLLSSPCSENDAKIELKKGYIYDFVVKDDNRTLAERNNCQFSKCFSLSAGPEICMNYTTPRDCNDIQTVHSCNQQVSTICQQCPRCPMLCSLFDGSTWTVIQKRFDGSEDFYKSWDEYKNGFGTAAGEFWIGNQALFELTSTARYELIVILNDFRGKQYHARYSTFSVGSESSNFVLTISGYSGNAGDYLTFHNEMQFSTYNRDNDQDSSNCAVIFKGAWFYADCYQSNLNGIYYPVETVDVKSMNWKDGELDCKPDCLHSWSGSFIEGYYVPMLACNLHRGDAIVECWGCFTCT